jgi:hypothetical protein
MKIFQQIRKISRNSSILKKKYVVLSNHHIFRSEISKRGFVFKFSKKDAEGKTKFQAEKQQKSERREELENFEEILQRNKEDIKEQE